MTDALKTLEEILFNNLVVEPGKAIGLGVKREQVEAFNRHFGASIDLADYNKEENEK